MTQPTITTSGNLSIPFASPRRYHWWLKDGQPIVATLDELGASLAMRRAHDMDFNRDPGRGIGGGE